MNLKTEIVIMALLYCLTLSAERVSGYVTDEQGQPLDRVLVKSSDDFAITREDGIYHLSVTVPDTVLFHKLGYAEMRLAADSIPLKLVLNRTALSIAGRDVAGSRYNDQPLVRRLITISDNQVENESLAGFIAAETGLQLNGTRTAGTQQTLKVPGYESRHTLVMLDGIPLNIAGEEFDLSRVPLSLIAEIEIISAAGTAGSGGMGTVINLKTGQPRQPVELETAISYGSFDYYTANLRYSRIFQRFTWQTNISYQQAENDFTYPAPENWNLVEEELTRENNSFRQADISAFFTYRTQWGDWDIKAYYTDFIRMLPGAINNPEQFYKAQISGEIFKGQFSWNYDRQKLNYSWKSWYNQENTVYDNTRLDEAYINNIYYYICGKNNKKSSGIRPQINWKPVSNINLKLGAEQLYESYKYEETVHQLNSQPEVKRTSQAIFSELALNLEKGRFSPWLKLDSRYDVTEDFSPETSGGAFCGIAYESQLKLSASFGRLWSYTLPSFYSLYWQGNAEAIGNPDLKPETSSGYKTAASLQYLDNMLSFSCRKDELQDMIIWIESVNKAWKPVNIGEAQVTNLEYMGELTPAKNINFKGSYTQTISADKTRLENGEASAYYNKELIYTPDYQGNLGINWSPAPCSFNINMQFTGSQWTTRDQLTQQKLLAEYQLYNCSAGWNMKYRNWLITWQLQINNLLDEHYNIYEYMPQPGRNYSFTIKLKKRIR
ncbi:MAG: TonB-dependent receptor [Candidatus Cloacimonetes bacterium]|nr:TonB-dependent receptor [Candidatus Cloacimonadota bacterium]